MLLRRSLAGMLVVLTRAPCRYLHLKNQSAVNSFVVGDSKYVSGQQQQQQRPATSHSSGLLLLLTLEHACASRVSLQAAV